jgi:IS605 OrfB family transposase
MSGVKRFEVPDGWVVQAFDFALDLTGGQAAVLPRQFGGRRYAYNWAVRTLKDDIEAFHAGRAGPELRPPSMIGLRKRWNQTKDSLCVDADSGEVWWPAVSKETFADGIKGTVNLAELRRLSRQRSRRRPGSIRYRQANAQIARLHAQIASIRGDAISKLTTRLAKTHGTVVVETLGVAGMLAQKGAPGARTRRRRLADSALAGVRARLRYKQAWYGCRLVEADRYYPSSQLCSGCGHQAAIGWAEEWDCPGCGAHHHRDDNAAVNLARYPACGWQRRAVGPVGSPVKRRAGRKPGPRPALKRRNPTPRGVPHEPCNQQQLSGNGLCSRLAVTGLASES